jgi:ERCC4-type nuclease
LRPRHSPHTKKKKKHDKKPYLEVISEIERDGNVKVKNIFRYFNSQIMIFIIWNILRLFSQGLDNFSRK